MDELKGNLMDGARQNGICAEGYNHMRNSDVNGLISYYVQHPDWCLERSYPSIDFIRGVIRDGFDRNFLASYGIHVDEDFGGVLLDGHQTYIFHGCKGRIRVAMNREKVIIPMLYFANGCDMAITCEQDNYGMPIRVPLYIFGDNNITARDDEHAHFVWYKTNLR